MAFSGIGTECLLDMMAVLAYDDIMKTIQYSVRRVPKTLDESLRARARREGRSLNETVLEVLNNGLGLAPDVHRHTDLDDLAGTWVEDPEFDKVVGEMDRVDPELWR